MLRRTSRRSDLVALLKSPSSGAVADVPDELVSRYEAGGWTAVKRPAAAPAKQATKESKPAPRRSRKSE
ncbi:DUF7302 family protein [Nesterenkonia aurantiaca]|uniref:DUF7302 family protein n=1 Tax=Nesterenkonia aurantiaca TaxID=1436010 RepID=UPI003F4C61BE